MIDVIRGITMTQMGINEIQDISLAILKHIDAFCRDKGLRYYLDSGTLLGAARHNGFIPWDDDADIVMPRPDYERFVNEYIDCDEYRLYAPQKNNSFLPYARLCEMKRTYFGQVSIWTRESPGVGVDIFPLDGAPDSAEEYDKLSVKIVTARDKIWRLRSILSGRIKIAFRKDLWGFAKDCIHYIVFRTYRANPEFFIKRHINSIRKLRLKYPYEACNNCFYIVINSSRGKFWRKEWFSDATYLDFCGERFPVPIGYDARLTAEYGDWRTPPPESERMGHSKCQTMYWRDK